MPKIISSPHNKTIKQLLRLQEKSRHRRKEGLFIVEGLREIQLALSANYQAEQLFACPEICSPESLVKLTAQFSNLTEISEQVYKKIAYRSSTEGFLALMHNKSHQLDHLTLSQKQPLILVAEAPEKPGNIGALLRTADAANADAVLIANPRTDLYNPNIIRSSVGCVFTTPVATGSAEEIIQFLHHQHINIYCATLQASVNYTTQDYTKATAIVVGTEADGLEQIWRDNATQNIIIPMQGQIDSMNVSVSAGILIFEAKRQRQFT